MTEAEVDKVLDVIDSLMMGFPNSFDRDKIKQKLREAGILKQSALDKARGLKDLLKEVGGNPIKMAKYYEQAIKELQDKED